MTLSGSVWNNRCANVQERLRQESEATSRDERENDKLLEFLLRFQSVFISHFCAPQTFEMPRRGNI